MRTTPLLADFTHTRVCKPFCEKYLTLPDGAVGIPILLHLLLPGSDGAGVDGAVWPQELLQLFQGRGVGFQGVGERPLDCCWVRKDCTISGVMEIVGESKALYFIA